MSGWIRRSDHAYQKALDKLGDGDHDEENRCILEDSMTQLGQIEQCGQVHHMCLCLMTRDDKLLPETRHLEPTRARWDDRAVKHKCYRCWCELGLERTRECKNTDTLPRLESMYGLLVGTVRHESQLNLSV